MKKTLWILLDDRKGSVSQAQGIAQALNGQINIIEKQIVYNRWAALPNWIRGKTFIGVNIRKSDNIIGDYPDFIMSTSRRTVPVARCIKKLSDNRSKIIQLMYPSGGIGLKEMDLVVVPTHDDLKKQQLDNALVILGAPTKITPAVLVAAKAKWQPVFSHLPRPYTTVIVGGAIKGKAWPLADAADLADKIKQMHDKIGGSILITTSRRTGVAAQDIIMQKLKDIPMYTYVWGEKKDNPLLGFYACADKIVVTADSVSMCSEACGTEAPVLLFRNEKWLPKKHCRFAATLIEKGYAIDLNDSQALEFKPRQHLNSAKQIAAEIMRLTV